MHMYQPKNPQKDSTKPKNFLAIPSYREPKHASPSQLTTFVLQRSTILLPNTVDEHKRTTYQYPLHADLGITIKLGQKGT